MDLRGLTVDKRRKIVEDNLKIRLSQIGEYSKDLERASMKNCENMIGASQIPLGVAGPLKIQNSEFRIQNYYIPLATTEGALIASVNRGCKAISLSGGANAYSYKVGATRGPVFYTGNLENEKRLYKWVKENEDKIKKAAEKT